MARYPIGNLEVNPEPIHRVMNRIHRLLPCATLFAAVFTLSLGTATDGRAESKPRALDRHFAPLRADFGKGNPEKVKLISGPEPVKMLRGQSPGKVWKASLGKTEFKITIEDKLDMDVSETFERLQRNPAGYRHAFAIVSEDKKDGVAFYANLDGAAAHGSQDYLNLVPKAGAMVVAHEVGHILEQRATRADPTILDQWKETIAADKISVSAYGDTVVHEDLAEFAMIYALCLDAGKERLAELRKLSPSRFALWETILKTTVP